jgi:hypothetical protein
MRVILKHANMIILGSSIFLLVIRKQCLHINDESSIHKVMVELYQLIRRNNRTQEAVSISSTSHF